MAGQGSGYARTVAIEDAHHRLRGHRGESRKDRGHPNCLEAKDRRPVRHEGHTACRRLVLSLKSQNITEYFRLLLRAEVRKCEVVASNFFLPKAAFFQHSCRVSVIHMADRLKL